MDNDNDNDIIIVGGGIGGLTLALCLHRAGIGCRVYESATQFKAVGAGINILPHATRILDGLDLTDDIAKVAVATRDATFFNRYGQLIYQEPLGRDAGYQWPQFSIHRGDLQKVLLDTVRARLGQDKVFAGWHCHRIEQDDAGATAYFRHPETKEELPPQHGAAVIACDGIRSRIRKQFYPDEGEPLYTGVNMWRGVVPAKPCLSGASMVRAGWLATGKIVIYPMRELDDGNQLYNWTAELETPHYKKRDWNRPGDLDDFIHAFESMKFDWLDIPAMLHATEEILEFPMVDQEPLPRWTFGRVTLLGDAAHPMVPRGSNGGGQAIVDARALTDCLKAGPDIATALRQYEELRLEPTANVVRSNRVVPPDAILGEVYKRTGDKPFDNIDDVISPEELKAITDRYKQIAGYSKTDLTQRA